MPFVVPIDIARRDYPEFEFIRALTPSVQKAAFHVRDGEGNDLCLKIIAPDYCLDRLNREIQALQNITHPNVARFKGYTYSSRPGYTRHFLIEEFIDGDDLTPHIGPGKEWPFPEAAVFFIGISSGLFALEEANIVHRDLKPSNIRVRGDRTPVIIDLGLARHLDLPDLTLTEQGARIGTPRYFAPEQCVGTKRDIDRRTDLFALGVLLFEALTSRHPFILEDVGLYEAICHSEAHFSDPVFRDLPSGWKLLIKRLLEKERAKRPFSANQVIVILNKIGGGP